MFDVWIGDVNLAPFLWIFTLVVVLPIQLALCFKVKSKVVRLLPVIILSILTLCAAIASCILRRPTAAGAVTNGS